MALGAGCDQKRVTEYVPGVSTQLTVPRDVKAICIDISVKGASQWSQGYKAYDGKVQLPRSLGNFAQTNAAITNVNGPVTYTIVGVLNDQIDDPYFQNCLNSTVGKDNAKILRRSRQPYITDEVLFLPMPLKFSCYDKDCPDKEQTCKGGVCVSATLTEEQVKATLKPYTPELLDGTGSDCFHDRNYLADVNGAPQPFIGCMSTAQAAITIDAATCKYAVPGSRSAPAPLPLKIEGAPSIPTLSAEDLDKNQGVNVEVVYDGGRVREILDLDAQEGFFVPDGSKPETRQIFQLAPGLCDLVKGVGADGKATTHRITAVRAAGLCRSKLASQPLCANDQLSAMGVTPDGLKPTPEPPSICSSKQLTPPRSGLVVLVDNTPVHKAFFDALKNTTIDPANEETLVLPAVKGALSAPAFDNTDIGLVYAPGTPDHLCALDPPDKALGPARSVRDPILADLTSKALAPSSPPKIGAALARAYAALQGGDYFKRAVLVLGNNGFIETASCAGKDPVAEATAAKNDPKSVLTYVMQLTNQPPKPDPSVSTWDADTLANAGGTDTAAYRATDGTAKFQKIVNTLATCVYDTAGGDQLKDTDTVMYTSPLTAQSTELKRNAACTKEGVAGEGWGSTPTASGQRIFLCEDSCKAYQAVLAQATTFSTVYKQPPLAVPVFGIKKCDSP
jgi:hypothetical protein